MLSGSSEIFYLDHITKTIVKISVDLAEILNLLAIKEDRHNYTLTLPVMGGNHYHNLLGFGTGHNNIFCTLPFMIFSLVTFRAKLF